MELDLPLPLTPRLPIQTEVSQGTASQAGRYFRRRKSLSEWYVTDAPSSSDHESTETGGDADAEESRYFIGDAEPAKGFCERSCGSASAGIDDVVRSSIRGICADYFENNISPLLRYVQQAQERFDQQLQELRDGVGKKADRSEVLVYSQIDEIVAKRLQDNGTVSSLVRLQELAASVHKKADAANVPTLAQLRSSTSAVELKISSMVESLAAVVKSKADMKDDVPTHSDASVDAKKMQVIVAAAGARFDKQLREVRQQLKELQAEVRRGVADPRWPCRVVGSSDSLPEAPELSDAASENSLRSVTARSTTGLSTTGSTAGLDPEDLLELKKFQAVVGAAGTAFNRDLRAMQKQVRDLRDELAAVKISLAAQNVDLCPASS